VSTGIVNPNPEMRRDASRRSFLKTGMAGAAGLVIGFYLPGKSELLAEPIATMPPASLNAWMLISTDNTVTM